MESVESSCNIKYSVWKDKILKLLKNIKNIINITNITNIKTYILRKNSQY